jgi:hypothetical protein
MPFSVHVVFNDTTSTTGVTLSQIKLDYYEVKFGVRWYEAIVVFIKALPRILLEGLRKAVNNSVHCVGVFRM